MDEMDGVDAYKREQVLVLVGFGTEFLAVVSVVGLVGLVGWVLVVVAVVDRAVVW